MSKNITTLEFDRRRTTALIDEEWVDFDPSRMLTIEPFDPRAALPLALAYQDFIGLLQHASGAALDSTSLLILPHPSVLVIEGDDELQTGDWVLLFGFRNSDCEAEEFGGIFSITYGAYKHGRMPPREFSLDLHRGSELIRIDSNGKRRVRLRSEESPERVLQHARSRSFQRRLQSRFFQDYLIWVHPGFTKWEEALIDMSDEALTALGFAPQTSLAGEDLVAMQMLALRSMRRTMLAQLPRRLQQPGSRLVNIEQIWERSVGLEKMFFFEGRLRAHYLPNHDLLNDPNEAPYEGMGWMIFYRYGSGEPYPHVLFVSDSIYGTSASARAELTLPLAEYLSGKRITLPSLKRMRKKVRKLRSKEVPK